MEKMLMEIVSIVHAYTSLLPREEPLISINKTVVKDIRTTKRISIAIIGVLLIIIISFVMYQQLAIVRSEPVSASDWPAMSMVYRTEGHCSGLSSPTCTIVKRLQYHDDMTWEYEVLENTSDPTTVGETFIYDGSALTINSASGLPPTYRERDPSVNDIVPEWWLVPGRYQDYIDNKGYLIIGDEGALRTITHTESLPCTGYEDAIGVTEPETCRTSDSYDHRETITYRMDVPEPIPVLILTEMNGEFVSRTEVTELVVDEMSR